MTTENTNVTDDTTVTTEETVVETNQTEQKTVSKAEFDKVLSDMHKYKKTLREIESNKKTAELQALKEKQEWQKIAEMKEQEANEFREQKEKLTKAVVTDKKMSAVREAAMKAGILDSALDDIDLLAWNDVEVETTSTGRINVNGAEDAIKRLKMTKPHWFGKPTTKVNSKIPDVNNQKTDVVTLEKLNKLRKDAMQSGDYSVYEPAFKAYQAQISGKV
jgi:hypothetical protein